MGSVLSSALLGNEPPNKLPTPPDKSSKIKIYPYAVYGGHHPKWWDTEKQRIWIWQGKTYQTHVLFA
ncbi:hypothetical protein BT96DRAFT_925202 [Gymnopus androsaceus JB14]|uniref:Uncharacterized protein n=1 Tax=Gymnopus androsaceus JB14 TaxID=1447944 RepID=A0A6A4H3B2_9AGAR|nr:hypothetical protein BT96DRAFT_925202 [Gymnopus androsaceus JB14]